MKRFSYRGMIMMLLLVTAAASFVAAQSVPQGIHYQAVARDNTGKEMSDRNIDVRFSIISGTPLGPLVYQELHQAVRTTRYGVFTLIIGTGIPTGGTVGELSQIAWGAALHFLKVEVKFLNDFSDMGTMQFLSVPYALFAAKSLEAGPAGPVGPQGIQGIQGPPGDPASDKQTLSFNGNILTISGYPGNWVDLSALINDADSDPKNEIQDLEMVGQHILRITDNAAANPIDLAKYDQRLLWNPLSRKLVITNSTDTIDLSRILSFNSTTNTLSISGGNTIDLSSLKNDADSDPTNEIQNLNLTGDILKITNNASATDINLGVYRDNTDNQTLTYNPSTYTLSITNGGPVSLGGLIAFRAKKNVSSAGLSPLNDYDFIPEEVDYNDGSGYDPVTGIFTANQPGIYTFNMGYNATGSGDARVIKFLLNGSLYEVINSGITAGTQLSRSVTLKLTTGDKVKVRVNTGISTESGTGTFSGFRVY